MTRNGYPVRLAGALMFLLRESSRDDLGQILEVAEHLDTVNLPADRDEIDKLLALSEQSFAETIETHEREYLFVLEDSDTKRVIGTSMIHAQHGTKSSPHVFFQILKDQRYSETIDRFFVHRGLRLGYNYEGPSEIGGLILLPAYRGHPASLGKLLSYTRFLFIAMHRTEFRPRILSELMPPLESDRTSVLWEHLGRRFTGLSYQEADMKSKRNKEFIRALFPHSIIYTSLLPQSVQDVIGKVGPDTKGVEKMLCRIGFRYANQIDPFDGGPHFIANTDDVTLIKNARRVVLRSVDSADHSRPWAVLAVERNSRPGFFATGARVIPLGNTQDGEPALGVTKEVQQILGVKDADAIWTTIP